MSDTYRYAIDLGLLPHGMSMGENDEPDEDYDYRAAEEDNGL